MFPGTIFGSPYASISITGVNVTDQFLSHLVGDTRDAEAGIEFLPDGTEQYRVENGPTPVPQHPWFSPTMVNIGVTLGIYIKAHVTGGAIPNAASDPVDTILPINGSRYWCVHAHSSGGSQDIYTVLLITIYADSAGAIPLVSATMRLEAIVGTVA